jgi:hypothetical protein
MTSGVTWMDTWATCAEVFRSHHSPTYATLADSLAAAPEPAVPEVPLVVLAAIRRAALEGRATDPFGGDAEALRRDARSLAAEIATAVELGLVQYTDPIRLGDLLPGVLVAARWYPGRPVRIVDLGASAGIVQLAPFLSLRFPTGTWQPAGALAAIEHPMEVPAELLATPLEFASAVGIDLRPLDVRRPEDATLLRSYTWPGPVAREVRLETAIRIAQERPPHLIEGDAVTTAPDVIRTGLDADTVTVVIDSGFSHYLPDEARTELGRHLDVLRHEGSLVLLARGPSLFDDPHRTSVRAIDLTGRRRIIYAETDFISEQPLWLSPAIPQQKGGPSGPAQAPPSQGQAAPAARLAR